MADHERIPTMADSLSWLRGGGIDIGTVLDVGILKGTPALMKVYADKQQLLFEPVDLHFDDIRKNYAHLDYVLHHVALSSSDGEAYVIGRSVDNGSNVTHAHIADAPMDDDPRVLSCTRVRKARLDTLLAECAPAPPFLLKLDVDGHEEEILKGASRTLASTAVVVIEAPLTAKPLPQILTRMQCLIDLGFRLFDIVDLAYYRGTLSQVDMVFVRADIYDSNDRLVPWQKTSFDRAKWYPLTARVFHDV